MADRKVVIVSNELYHHGIPKMEWGKRRWQYEDGSLTPAGYIHYGVNKPDGKKKKEKSYADENGNLTDAGKMKYLRTRERVNFVEKRLGKKTQFDYRSAGALRASTIVTMTGIPKTVISAVIASSLGAIGGSIMYQIDKSTLARGRAFMNKIEKEYGYYGGQPATGG